MRKKCKYILIEEKHSVHGGLGSAVAEVVSTEAPALVDRMGLHAYSESGDYEILLKKAQLDSGAIVR